MTGKPIGRRRAFGLIGLGTASVAVGATGWAMGWGLPRGAPSVTGQALAEPAVLASCRPRPCHQVR